MPESNLTKTAIAGHDANWGRILCAMGYSGAQFDPEKVDLYFESAAGKLKIIENGVALDYSEEEATKVLSEKAVTAVKNSTHEIIVFFMVIQIIIKKLYGIKPQSLRQK